MISELGRLLVLAALLFAAFGAPIGIVAGMRRSRHGLDLARKAAVGFGVAMLAANALMVHALVVNDFSVSYVAQVGSRATPLIVKIPSLWSSLEGSILFWGGVLGVYVLAFVGLHGRQHREYMPWALGILLSVAVFFAVLVSGIANPFAPISPVPTDGPGPNPLLQNHWLMAVHPPTLYLGFVGMTVPFAMASAALFAGRLEAGWMAPLRRWLLVPWAFLTTGILLGGWWSYAVLGWGGYWAWDPVENASFLPWLTGTAALHSALVTQRRGTLKTWTLLLVMLTFLLTLFGTFLTRSGVFNSVHSFTQSDIGPVFLGFIALVFLFQLVLLATRDHVLGAQPAERGTWRSPLSREFVLFVQNLVFVAFTAMVLLGTIFPLLVEAIEGRRLSVGEPYFDRMALPLGLLLVVLMGVGPALPWGRMDPRAAARRFLPPLIGGVLLAGLGAVTGFAGIYTLFALFVCGFAAVATVEEFVLPARRRAGGRGEPLPVALGRVVVRGRVRYGGLVAHLAVIVVVAGIALSKGYAVEHDVTLAPGETARIGEWSATFTGARLEEHPHRDSLVAAFLVTRGGREVGTVEPRLNYYTNQREPIGTPAIRTTPTGDFYMSLMQVEQDGSSASVRVMMNPGVPWIWVAMPFFGVGALMVLWPRRTRAARAAAVAEGEAA